jgi:hypothetical protein
MKGSNLILLTFEVSSGVKYSMTVAGKAGLISNRYIFFYP